MDTIEDHPVLRRAKSDQRFWLERVREVCECLDGLILGQGVGLIAPVLRDQPAVFQQRAQWPGCIVQDPKPW